MDRRAPVTVCSEAGSSLIEVLIAGVIIAISIIAIFQILSQGSWLNHQAMLQRRAYQELDHALENPKYSSRSPFYMDLDDGQVDSTNVVLDDRGDADSTNNLVGKMRISVASVSFTYNGTVTIPAKRITATLTYTDNGKTYQDNLETVVTMTDVN